jgi:hypothetical protein
MVTQNGLGYLLLHANNYSYKVRKPVAIHIMSCQPIIYIFDTPYPNNHRSESGGISANIGAKSWFPFYYKQDIMSPKISRNG